MESSGAKKIWKMSPPSEDVLDVLSGGVPGRGTSAAEQSHGHRAGVDHTNTAAGEELQVPGEEGLVHQGAPAHQGL